MKFRTNEKILEQLTRFSYIWHQNGNRKQKLEYVLIKKSINQSNEKKIMLIKRKIRKPIWNNRVAKPRQLIDLWLSFQRINFTFACWSSFLSLNATWFLQNIAEFYRHVSFSIYGATILTVCIYFACMHFWTRVVNIHK